MRIRAGERIRKKSGFILAAVILFCFASILLLTALLPLIDNVIRLESLGRQNSELREAADYGIDYAVQELNNFAESKPGQTNTTLVNAGSYNIPTFALSAFTGTQITVSVRSIDLGNFKYGSTIYSSELAKYPLGTPLGYLVLESTARRGLLKRSLRCFLQPSYNVPENGIPMNQASKQSYFNLPLFATELRRDLTTELVVTRTNSQSQLAYYPPLPANSSINLNEGTLAETPPDRSPMPEPGISKNLTSDAQGKYSLEPGTYTTNSIDFSSTNPVTFNQSSNPGPTKIFIQDGPNSPAAAVSIKTDAFSNSIASQNFQIWYNGTRDINIEITKDFNGLIYAKNANVSLSGNGRFSGAIVGKIVSLNSGAVNISTDVTDVGNGLAPSSGLLHAIDKHGSPTPHGYKIVSWQELSAASN